MNSIIAVGLWTRLHLVSMVTIVLHIVDTWLLLCVPPHMCLYKCPVVSVTWVVDWSVIGDKVFSSRYACNSTWRSRIQLSAIESSPLPAYKARSAFISLLYAFWRSVHTIILFTIDLSVYLQSFHAASYTPENLIYAPRWVSVRFVFCHKPWEIDVYHSLSVYGHFDPSVYLLAAASHSGTLHFRMSCKFTSLWSHCYFICRAPVCHVYTRVH